MFFKRLLRYIDITSMFRDRDDSPIDPEADDAKGSRINLSMMHGINRISIFMFLICLAVMAWRYFSR